MLVAVPVPKEQEADGLVVKKAVDEVRYHLPNKAIAEAQTLGIQGAEITPFLLKRINELSQGDSSRSNIALIKNNARVGASIAVAVSKLQAKKFN
jgi:pseudouridine-5'-phosphate glycosidase